MTDNFPHPFADQELIDTRKQTKIILRIILLAVLLLGCFTAALWSAIFLLPLDSKPTVFPAVGFLCTFFLERHWISALQIEMKVI